MEVGDHRAQTCFHAILQLRGAGVRFLEVVVALAIREFEHRRPKLTSRERGKINLRPIFLMHLNNSIRDCCFFLHTKVSNLHTFKRSWLDNDFPCPVSVLNM